MDKHSFKTLLYLVVITIQGTIIQLQHYNFNELFMTQQESITEIHRCLAIRPLLNSKNVQLHLKGN